MSIEPQHERSDRKRQRVVGAKSDGGACMPDRGLALGRCQPFLQTLMLAAHVRGLATCPQVAFVRYEQVIARHLELAADEALACGMSLGYPDGDAGVNRILMPRSPVAAFTSWHGFDEAPP